MPDTFVKLEDLTYLSKGSNMAESQNISEAFGHLAYKPLKGDL
jgi:hypothetical protein